MRCYLCSSDVDVADVSGVPVCLGCRRREHVYADVTPPEMRAQNEAFMRLFGPANLMVRRDSDAEKDYATRWHALCDEILSRDAIAQKLVRGDFGPPPPRIFGETLARAESDVYPIVDIGCDDPDCDADAHGSMTMPRKDYDALLKALGDSPDVFLMPIASAPGPKDEP